MNFLIIKNDVKSQQQLHNNNKQIVVDAGPFTGIARDDDEQCNAAFILGLRIVAGSGRKLDR